MHLPFAMRRTRPLIGIDIGSSAIKIVVLSKPARHLRLEHYAKLDIVDGTIEDQEIRDIGAISELLAQLRAQLPRHLRNVAAALPSSQVMSKVIYMEAGLSDEELGAQIQVEADNLIPYPLDEVSIDFEPIGGNSREASKVDVMLSVCRTEHVQVRASALEAAQFVPKVMDIDGHALGRSLRLQKSLLQGYDTPIAMLDIGARLITLCVVYQDELLFTQQIDFGSDELTQALGRRYALRHEEAEQHKLSGDFPADAQEAVLQPFIDRLSQQCQRLLQMFYSSTSHGQVAMVLLSGGGARLAQLDAHLQSQLDVPVKVVDPFISVELAKGLDSEALRMVAPQLAIAAGLAMRSFAE